MEKIGHLQIRISGTQGNVELKPDTYDVRELIAVTGEIDRTSLKFLELIDYDPTYDSDYLKDLRKKAMNWLGAVKPDDWLRDIRGGYDA